MNLFFRNIFRSIDTLIPSLTKKVRLSSCIWINLPPSLKALGLKFKTLKIFILTLLTMILVKLGRFFHVLASLRSLMYKLIIFPCCVASSPAFDEVDIYLGHFLSKCWTPVKSIDLRGNKVGMAKSDIRQKKD